MAKVFEHEKIPTDPYQYKGAYAFELGYDNELPNSQYFDFISPETGQLTGVFVTDPVERPSRTPNQVTAPKRTIIYPQQHEYRNEPSSMARLQQVATAYNARVIGVETVGTVGLMKADENGRPEIRTDVTRLKGDRQTGQQLWSALKGDFRPHAAMQLEAIEGTVGMDTDTRYTIFGESMGAAVATDILGLMKERGYDVDEVVLFEMVNAFEGRRALAPFKLMNSLGGEENNRRNKYIQENTDIDHPMTAFELVSDEQKRLDSKRKSLGQQGRAGVVNGLGMAMGRSASLQASLELFEKQETPLLTLVRGRESLVASGEDYVRFATQLALGGYAVRTFEVTNSAKRNADRPIGHSHLFSLGRGKDVYDTLAKR